MTHYFPTRRSTDLLQGKLSQKSRARRPDGLFMGAMFGGDTLTELRQALAQAEIEREGGLSPRVSPFADLRDMGSLMQRAGFALPVVDTDRVTVRYADMFRLMAELRGMGETRSEEHTSALQSLMRISYAVVCLKKKPQ